MGVGQSRATTKTLQNGNAPALVKPAGHHHQGKLEWNSDVGALSGKTILDVIEWLVS
jgi:hypothetical protein